MYQTIIRDPGGSNLIRVIPNICDSSQSVVNGSILIVPPGTVSYVAINGQLSRAYTSGRYELFTGVDPFFVRFRHIMANGDAGITVSVFFISYNKCQFMTIGTGEFPFKENRFHITMKALASCSVVYTISDPLKVLTKLVGSYNNDFTGDEIEPCIKQIIITPVRESLSQELSNLSVTDFNSHLTEISNHATPSINLNFDQYGLKLKQFKLTAINISENDIQRLYALEQNYAEGKTRTDLEIDHLNRIWNGNTDNRTISEMMTGLPSRGQETESVSGANRNASSLTSTMLQMMMMSQFMPNLRDSLSTMNSSAGLSHAPNTTVQPNVSAESSPPPMPSRNKTCPSCKAMVSRDTRTCPICGYKFN